MVFNTVNALRSRWDYLPVLRGGDGVGRKVASGSIWSGLSVGATTLLQLARSVIFARLLMPEDFGIMSLANVFTQFILIFANFGFNSSVIYHEKLDKRDLSTCWWGNLGVDTAAAIACILIALTTSKFAEDPRVAYIVCLLAMQFIITSLGSVNAALMRREFMFKQKAIVEFLGVLGTFLGAWFCVAVLDWGVYGLVSGMIAGSLLMTVLNIAYLPWLPSFLFSRAVLRKHLSYGLWFLGVNVVTYTNTNIDKATVGTYLSLTQLGFYEYASAIPLMVVQKLAQTLNSVLFPAFSSLQNDPQGLHDLLVKLYRYNALIIFPLLVGIGLVAPEFIEVAYGEKWASILTPLRLFCLFGILRLYINPLYPLCNGVGKPHMPFRWSLIFLPINVGLLFLGVKYVGVTGAVLARLGLPIFMMATLGTQIMRHVKVPVLDLMKATIPALWACLGMGVVVTGTRELNFAVLDSTLWRLLILVAVGAVTYLTVLLALWRSELSRLIAFARAFGRSGS